MEKRVKNIFLPDVSVCKASLLRWHFLVAPKGLSYKPIYRTKMYFLLLTLYLILTLLLAVRISLLFTN